MDNLEKVKNFSQSIAKIKDEIKKDVVGQEDIVDNVITAIIAGGNVLLEGVPGVGKTRLVRSLGKTLNLPFARIQFTPDLMPSDVTGTNVIEKDENGKMNVVFQKGPIFANLILADEINRATPKTQSAMLEVMQEHKVTVANTSYKMQEPFFVLATENPIEQDGTYPLPEAQMDRFMFKVNVPNPSIDELCQIVDMTQKTMAEVADCACDKDQLLEMRETANQIPVAAEVLRYAMILISATHPNGECASDAAKKYIRVGASPRAGQALISAAKVMALIKGRLNVAYTDINELAFPVLRHRIKLNFEAIAERVTADDIIKMIVDEVSKKYKGKD
jgi:MoxR-like ATPase